MSLASTGCIATAPRSCSSPRTRATPSRLWGQPNASPYVKDAFHEYIVSGRGEAVNPAKVGTKAAAHYVLDVPAGGSTDRPPPSGGRARVDDAFGGFEEIVQQPDRRRGRILRSDYADVAERR